MYFKFIVKIHFEIKQKRSLYFFTDLKKPEIMDRCASKLNFQFSLIFIINCIVFLLNIKIRNVIMFHENLFNSMVKNLRRNLE